MKRRTLLLSALGVALIAAPALAEPVEYQIDSGHTHVRFSVERFGFANTIGLFPDSAGIIVLDVDNPEASRVEAHVLTPTVWTGLEARDGHVRGPAWLNTEAHSDIRFVSTDVSLTGETSAIVTGDLTLWGETRPVSFDATLNRMAPDPSLGGREAAGFTLSGTLNRSDFGHTIASSLIGDEVRIDIDVLAHAMEVDD